jgi:hypothetical protein
MTDCLDPSNKATGGISGTQPTIQPGRKDLRKKIRIFQPSVLKPEEVGFRERSGDGDQ